MAWRRTASETSRQSGDAGIGGSAACRRANARRRACRPYTRASRNSAGGHEPARIRLTDGRLPDPAPVADGADLLGVVLLVFFLFKYFGGDPAEILGGLNATPEQVDAIRQQLGLDQPVWVQLWIFLKQIVTFDWGKQLGHQRGGQPTCSRRACRPR